MKDRFSACSERRRFAGERSAAARASANLTREWPALLVVLMLCCLLFSCVPFLRRADLAFLDIASRSVHRTATPRVVVIELDDRSVDALGGWPLSPAVHARLLDRLTDSGVAAIGFDLTATDMRDAPRDDMAALTAALRRNGRVIMRPSPQPASADVPGITDLALSHAMYASGDTDLLPDRDSVYRSVHLLSGGPRLDRHFAALLLDAAGMRRASCSAAEIAEVRSRGSGCLRYVPLGASRSFDTVSYVDVLHGKIPAAFLRGRLVLIGASAAGYGTPLATPMVGGAPLNRLDMLAEVTNALSTSTLIRPAGLRRALLFNESAVPLICVVLYLLGPRGSLLASAGVIGATLAVAYAVLRWAHVFVPPTAGVLTCAIAWPLWAWRRQEALLDYLSREAERGGHELPLHGDTADVARTGRFGDPVQRRLDAMALLSERVRRYRELVAQWVDTLPEATLVTSPDGIVLLANEQVVVLSEQSEVRRGAHGSSAGRPVADILFEITASHRAIEFATQALALLEPWSAGHALPPKAAALLSQGIEVTSARGGRSLLIKCAPIRPSAGRSRALIFHIADVSSMRKAERQRDMALRFLSHDMRSPQAAMLTLVEQMREEPPHFTQQRFIDLVTRYASTALRLSDDFLFLARAESVAPKLTRVDPALALGDAVDDFWPQASAKSTTVNLLAEPGSSLIADAQLLRRAFGNLIGNAIEYSPPASTVKVRLAETQRHLSISVVDQGIGISHPDKRQLFAEFSQIDMRFARSGHGLGLALVKTVVDSLGGRLFVRSTVGKGTIFTVRLPKAEFVRSQDSAGGGV